MHMLESAMAFAVVMIIFSTIVTGLVEVFLRSFALRQRTLTRTLGLFLKNEVRPALSAALSQAQAAVQTVDDANQAVEKLVKDFTTNPVQSRHSNIFSRWLAPRLERIDELTSYSFLQRLAKSELSATIRQLNDDQLNNYLANVTRTYERYMAASTEYYRKKSHVVTIIVSLMLALVFNVPAARVYMHLMDNPGTRAELINNAETVIDQNRQAEAAMRQFWLDQQETIEQAGAAAAAELTDEQAAEQAAKDAAEQAAITQKITELRDSLESLRSDTGLPIGPSMWPYCLGDSADRHLECTPAAKAKNDLWSYAYWLFNVLLAGVLIGLGGPFWAKIYTRLAQFAGRPISGGGNPELVSGDDGDTAAKKAARNPAAAFRVAAGEVNQPG